MLEKEANELLGSVVHVRCPWYDDTTEEDFIAEFTGLIRAVEGNELFIDCEHERDGAPGRDELLWIYATASLPLDKTELIEVERAR